MSGLAKLRRWLAKPAREQRASVTYRLGCARDALVEHWYWLVFERPRRLEFAGMIAPTDPHARAYEPSTGVVLRRILHEAVKAHVSVEHFVDLGSGKGKICIYAARERGFASITGVEFDAALVAIAEANRARAGLDGIRFLHQDARTFRLPDGPCFVFMFNPFDDSVINAFLAANRDHFGRHRSVIGYVNDQYRVTLAQAGFEVLFRDQPSKTSLHRFILPVALA